MFKRLIRLGFCYFSDGKKFVIRFYKIKRYGVSDLLKKAPRSFQILASYAKSCGVTLKIPYPPKKIKLNGETNYVWAAPGHTVWMPAPILDLLNDKNSEYWHYAPNFLAHEIGHIQDKKKRNCPFSTVGKWCLCPSWEIYAQKRGMEILKNLGILPEQKIIDCIINHFSEYIVDILKENKKCAKNLMEGKCPYLAWAETVQVIDCGI